MAGRDLGGGGGGDYSCKAQRSDAPTEEAKTNADEASKKKRRSERVKKAKTL